MKYIITITDIHTIDNKIKTLIPFRSYTLITTGYRDNLSYTAIYRLKYNIKLIEHS